MAMLMVLGGAKHSAGEEKKASVSPTCEYCKLQWWLSRQDESIGVIVTQMLYE